MARVTKINVGGTNYDIAHEGELKNSGFEVVTELPTTGLFAGREVFYRGKKYLYNGERWLYPIRFHQIADDSLITEPGWYNIGYYDDRFHPYDYNFDGILTISSAYSQGIGMSAIIAITSSFNEICITQLSGYRSYVIPQIRIVRDSNIRFLLQFQYATTSRNPVNITYTDYRSTNPYRNPFKPLFGKSDIEFEEAAIVKVFTLTQGVKTDYNVEGGRIIKTGGTATQMLMADGSTKDISGFATVATSGSYNDLTDKPNLATVATSGSYNDLTNTPTQLPNPNPIIIKTADGVSVRYDGSTSGGVTLEAGDNAALTATQDSDDTMTVKFGAVVPTKLPNPQALQIQVLDDAGAVIGSDILYDGLTAKILKLVAGYGIELNSVNLTGGQAVAINLKQIAGITLLGNVNGTTGTPQAVTMAQLRTMLGSLTLNDIDVTLGGNSSYTLPCYIDYNGTRYQCRISKDATGLQIYRNGAWVTIGKFCRCSRRGTITNSNLDGWYDDTVFDYEMDESVSADLYGNDLTGKFGTSMAGAWTGKTVTLNLASVSIKDTKSAWEMLKKNMGDCFPSDSVERIRYYYNVAIPSGEVVTKIELSYHNGVGMCTVHFYTEG